VTQAIRDAVVDFVRYWSDRAKILTGRLIAWLGIPSSKYYDWRRRYGRCNEHNAKIPRSHWLLDWEKAAILQYQQEHPEEGYRRLAYMMLDAGVVAASPSSVYRVLKNAERLKNRTSCPSPKGRGFAQPSAPHRHWHIDISYLNICGTFYYLCSVLDGYSRYMVHWEIRESMKEADVETVLQRAHERFPAATPRIISDNGPQFVARDFKVFIRQCGMTHVRTAPFYPQSNGKIESWHKTLKRECIRPKTPLNLADARRVVTGYVQHYNETRLHAGIGYVAPKDRLDGRDEAIRQNRRRKLADARITRRAAHHTQPTAPRTSLQTTVAAPVLP
jgi:transposase InsO family protein